MWWKFGNGLTDDDVFGASGLDMIDGFVKMNTYIMLGAELLTVITVLIIVGVLSSKEKKK